MRKNPCLILFLFLIISSYNIDQSYGKSKQGEKLTKFFKAKLNGNTNIDTSPYAENDNVVETTEANGGLTETNENITANIGSKEADKIDRLPGQPAVNFDQYGGYITVDKTAGRALYYYFVEAETSKESLPLVLWLNGGPGCSSLAYGAMQELGPFRVHSDGKTLYYNPLAWNKGANVLFLESPAGVGFSYSNRTTDYSKSGDRSTAADNYKFIVNWLERFPEYKERDFYITGESYAGHYIPQLAHNILSHNKAGKNVINLKGVALGNAAINDETDEPGIYEFFRGHALTSPETYEKIMSSCNFSPNFKGTQTQQCNDGLAKADNDSMSIDIYSIYAPLCHNSNVTAKPKRASVFMEFDPCSDYYVFAYMNREEVQNALHANVTKVKFFWDLCSDVINGWTDSPSTTLPLIQEIISSGLRVLIYSGDTDGRVPFTSTQQALKKMNVVTKTQWYPWNYQQEVGGYAQVYEGGLTFATVRGAGHEVPAYQPGIALEMIKYFLSGKPLPLLVPL